VREDAGTIEFSIASSTSPDKSY